MQPEQQGQAGTEPAGALTEEQGQAGTEPAGALTEKQELAGTEPAGVLPEKQEQAGTIVPVFGLPGHPGAAFFVAEIFIRPLLEKYAALSAPAEIKAVLRENLSANHGRAQYMAAVLERDEDRVYARPVYMKSGMITGTAAADGYFCVPRDAEGLPAGAEVTVIKFG